MDVSGFQLSDVGPGVKARGKTSVVYHHQLDVLSEYHVVLNQARPRYLQDSAQIKALFVFIPNKDLDIRPDFLPGKTE